MSIIATSMDRRTYTEADIERALAVVAGHRGNVSRASTELQIPRMTLHQWIKGNRRKATTESVARSRETAQAVTRLRMMRQWTILGRAAIKQSQATLSTADPWQAARIAGLAVDKMTALSGSTRLSDGPGVTVTLAQYFQSALPPKTVALVAGRDEQESERPQLPAPVPMKPQ